jgi:predicted TIM-barrel enzyme
MSEIGVLALARAFKREYPQLWLGINLLGRLPSTIVARVAEVGHKGVWADNAGVEESSDDQPFAQTFVRTRRELAWEGLYFGGVAFKYQRSVPPSLYSRAAKKAADFMDVVCTSGDGTGKAAALSKVEAMRQGVGEHALALASGVTAENVATYLPFIDAYLVGTGIESSFGVIDESKLRTLYERIHSF